MPRRGTEVKKKPREHGAVLQVWSGTVPRAQFEYAVRFEKYQSHDTLSRPVLLVFPCNLSAGAIHGGINAAARCAQQAGVGGLARNRGGAGWSPVSPAGPPTVGKVV